MTHHTPPVTLIISFYNKIDILERVLESVALQTLQDFEVIIADDGSQPNCIARIQQFQHHYTFPLRHVWHEDKGWRKNRILNQAVQQAQGAYIVFIDGDCLLDRRFLAEHWAARKQGQVITGRRVLLTPDTTKRLLSQPVSTHSFGLKLCIQLAYETIFRHRRTQMEQMIHLPQKLCQLLLHERKRYILGCNFSIHKEDLLRVNGFDERFLYPGYGEDIDLEFRLARAGIPAVSRKCQLIQYHCYHKHFDTDYAPNKQLLKENNDNRIIYTPYGIQQHHQSN